eukprot:Nitzschia sp. Nitz4//scaffold163_size50693//1485//2921//NITZ4_006980-RA/size50693-processed-gene-0.39-mRNA-1//-1//CDS//3329538007//8000//frame0
MLVSLNGGHKREVLPEDISTWPAPADSKRWVLTLNISSQEEEEDEYDQQVKHLVAKLEAAVSRQDVDTLKLFNTCIPSQTLKDLVTRLLVQDRDWKVHYFWTQEPNLDCDLAWLSLCRPVRCLAFTCLGEPKVSPGHMMPALRAMSNLEELDFTGISFRLSDFLQLCQDDFLACRITRITLTLHPGDACFPRSLSLPNLESFTLRVKEGASPLVRTQCMQQVCLLQKLQSLKVQDPYISSQEAESFSFLSDCIRSSSCQLRLLELDLNAPLQPQPQPHLHQQPNSSYLQTFFRAMEENHSIQTLSFSLGKHNFRLLTPLLDPISSPTSCVHHLELCCYGVPVEEAPAICDLLLQWQILMRNMRFICIRIVSWNVRSVKIMYVTRVHARWLRWQSKLRHESLFTHPGEAPPLSLAQMDPIWWANELVRIDQTSDPNLRPVSLDAMFFLLQHWLSGVSNVPSVSLGRMTDREGKKDDNGS